MEGASAWTGGQSDSKMQNEARLGLERLSTGRLWTASGSAVDAGECGRARQSPWMLTYTQPCGVMFVYLACRC